MRKCLLACLLVVFCDLHFFSQSAVCNYKYRKRISFNPAQVAGSSDLTNFTALISITSDNDLRILSSGGHVENASGYDIIFTSDDGVTKLDHQIEKYTSTTGEFVAWVRIPTLSTTYSTTIYMYYGNSAIGSDPSVDATWSSGYKGVWHLNNNVFTDATSTNNDATNSGSSNLTAAKIAGGRTFPGSGGNYIQLPLSGASGGSGNGSVELWGRITTYENSTYFFGETTTQTASYTDRVQLYTGDASGNLYLGLGGNHAIQSNIQTMALNTWYHIALTWATTGAGVGNYSVFVNGTQQGSGAYSNFSAIHSFADLGNDGNASQRNEEITGNIDEVHVTNTTLSASWITTEYNNQNSPSTFYSVSAEPKVWTGNTNNNTNAASNWLSNSGPNTGDDVIINNGTNQPILNNSFQLNSIFIRTNAILSLGTNSLGIRSDITNCGTLAGNTGLVVLNSSVIAVQNISGSGTNSLTNLTVNNTSSAGQSVMLNKNVDVYGSLTLSSGIVNTSATNILALGTSATSTSGSASSFVSGPMSKVGTASFVFPIGKGTRWRRAALSNISASSTYTAEYFNTPYSNTTPVNSPLNNVSIVEYWQVDRTGTGNANLTLYWEAANQSGITNCADLTIARWNGASWDERVATTTGTSSCSGAGAGALTTSAALTAFSPFTFGSKLSTVNPLPIELTSFESTCNGTEDVLNWSTASEKNNAYFLIERSLDGEKWESLEKITGAGNSNTLKKYTYGTKRTGSEITYYKLSQVDKDGTSKTFKVIASTCSESNDQFSTYPNPVDKELFIDLQLSQNYGQGQVKLVDALGKIVLVQTIELNKGHQVIKLPLNLEPGAYTLMLYSEHYNLSPQKIIVR